MFTLSCLLCRFAKVSALAKNNWVIFEIWWKLCIHRFRAVPAPTIILMGLNYGFINAVHTLASKTGIVREDELDSEMDKCRIQFTVNIMKCNTADCHRLPQ